MSLGISCGTLFSRPGGVEHQKRRYRDFCCILGVREEHAAPEGFTRKRLIILKSFSSLLQVQSTCFLKFSQHILSLFHIFNVILSCGESHPAEQDQDQHLARIGQDCRQYQGPLLLYSYEVGLGWIMHSC